MILLRIILFPFSLIYAFAMSVRNWMFNINLLKSVSFDLPVISVGNLRVGGTGKTPHVEFLIGLLHEDFNIATISRGYGRETRGFIKAENGLNAKDLGDEPLQLYKKYGDKVMVTVCEDRVLAIPRVISEKEETDLVILDDAFQHRFVKPCLNILLTSFDKPFYKDFILPTGMLREAHYGARRADVIIVTKCPEDISRDQMQKMERKIRRFSKNEVEIFFSGYSYAEPVSFGKKEEKDIEDVFLISGLASASQFKNHVNKKFNVLKEKDFPDHYDYFSDDMEELDKWFESKPDAALICTEKDYVKLNDGRFNDFFEKRRAFYIPVEVEFLDRFNEFKSLVYSKIR